MVIRPKSMATVVVVFPVTRLMSSIPSDTSVIRASVRSGGISDTAPTNVVFPTPKPPAITILTGTGASGGSAGTEPLQESFENGHVRAVGCPRWRVDGQVAARREIPDQDPRDTQRYVQARCQLDHRRQALAEVDDGSLFPLQRERPLPTQVGHAEQRLHRKLGPPGAGPAAGQRVGGNHTPAPFGRIRRFRHASPLPGPTGRA